jgi:ribosome biogenesis GTPase
VKGLVVKNTGSWYTVHADDGQKIECKIKGNFRLRDFRSTNPIAVGDRVSIEMHSEDTAFITEIEERTNYMIRKASNLSKQSHIIAANIDQAILVASVNYPVTTTIFIDRFLAVAEAYSIPVCIAFNKIDRYNAADKATLEALIRLYSSVGYTCFRICAAGGEGVDSLGEQLADRITLLSGHSGVGKSTLINRLIPGLELRTGGISEYHRKGMHTTTFSEMIPLPQGGYLIDTPGIKGFGTFDMENAEISHYFREIFAEAEQCRFDNCTHRREPGCAVLTAVDEGRINSSRYKSYLSILKDREGSKYREEYE